MVRYSSEVSHYVRNLQLHQHEYDVYRRRAISLFRKFFISQIPDFNISLMVTNTQFPYYTSSLYNPELST